MEGAAVCVAGLRARQVEHDPLRAVAGDYSPGQIRVVETALSDRQGSATLHFPGEHLGSASLELKDDVLQPPITVKTVSLDSYFESIQWSAPLRLIKCDVEYHELAVLRGAHETLSRHKPILLIESGDFVNEPFRLEPVNEFLNELGYHGCFFYQRRLVPIRHYDPSIHTPVDDDHQNYVYIHSDSETLCRTDALWSQRHLSGRSVA